MSDLLAGWSCPVVAAPDAEAALALLGARRPDVVLTDYHLDRGTGLEALAAARGPPRLRAARGDHHRRPRPGDRRAAAERRRLPPPPQAGPPGGAARAPRADARRARGPGGGVTSRPCVHTFFTELAHAAARRGRPEACRGTQASCDSRARRRVRGTGARPGHRGARTRRSRGRGRGAAGDDGLRAGTAVARPVRRVPPRVAGRLRRRPVPRRRGPGLFRRSGRPVPAQRRRRRRAGGLPSGQASASRRRPRPRTPHGHRREAHRDGRHLRRLRGPARRRGAPCPAAARPADRGDRRLRRRRLRRHLAEFGNAAPTTSSAPPTPTRPSAPGSRGTSTPTCSARPFRHRDRAQLRRKPGAGHAGGPRRRARATAGARS